jgi:hypothetical protein
VSAVFRRGSIRTRYQDLQVAERHWDLSNANDAQELSPSIETTWRPLECHPRYAHPAVYGVRGCAAPSRTDEVRMFRENESPLGGEGGETIECDADVTAGLGHGRDVNGVDGGKRDGYDESVVELNVGTWGRRSLFIYLELAGASPKNYGHAESAVEAVQSDVVEEAGGDEWAEQRVQTLRASGHCQWYTRYVHRTRSRLQERDKETLHLWQFIRGAATER